MSEIYAAEVAAMHDALKADPNEGIDPRRVSAIDGSISDPEDWR
jgi:hypothetical protein